MAFTSSVCLMFWSQALWGCDLRPHVLFNNFSTITVTHLWFQLCYSISFPDPWESISKTKEVFSLQEDTNRISFVFLLQLGSWREIVNWGLRLYVKTSPWDLCRTWYWGLLAPSCLGFSSSLCETGTVIIGQCHPRTCLIVVSVKTFGLFGKQTVWGEIGLICSFWKSLVLLPLQKQMTLHV